MRWVTSNGVGIKPQGLIGRRRIRPMEILCFNILVRPCRELLRGWLTTIRFVTNINWTRYGTDEFLGPAMGQGQCVKLMGLTHNTP